MKRTFKNQKPESFPPFPTPYRVGGKFREKWTAPNNPETGTGGKFRENILCLSLEHIRRVGGVAFPAKNCRDVLRELDDERNLKK